jgi:hypothetical protein
MVVRKENFDYVKILLFFGANPNLKDHRGKKSEEYLTTENFLLYREFLMI